MQIGSINQDTTVEKMQESRTTYENLLKQVEDDTIPPAFVITGSHRDKKKAAIKFLKERIAPLADAIEWVAKTKGVFTHKIGDRVVYNNGKKDFCGAVRESLYGHYLITWDDGTGNDAVYSEDELVAETKA